LEVLLEHDDGGRAWGEELATDCAKEVLACSVVDVRTDFVVNLIAD
jgi:hypothetical protein